MSARSLSVATALPNNGRARSLLSLIRHGIP
jgi:hypothetical protein